MQPVVPPTDAAKVHKRYLQGVMIAHILLSVMLMFLSIISGIYELISVAILWCATTQMHFCLLIIYMIICLNNFISYLAAIGLTI